MPSRSAIRLSSIALAIEAKRGSSSDNERDTVSARDTACSAFMSSASRSNCRISRAPDASRPCCDKRCRSAVSSVDLAGLEVQRLELAEVIAQQLQPRFAILRGSRRRGRVARAAPTMRGAVRQPSRAARDSRRSDRAARAARRASSATDIPSGRGYRRAFRRAGAVPARASPGCSRTRASGRRRRQFAAGRTRLRARSTARPARRSAAGLFAIAKVAETSARSAPCRTTSAPARPPAASSSASTRMDLPAPVSPVSTVRPEASSSSAASMIAKSRIWMCSSTRASILRFGPAARDRRVPSAASSAGCGNSRDPAGAAASRSLLAGCDRKLCRPARARRATRRRRSPAPAFPGVPAIGSPPREELRITIGRSDSVCGQIGASTSASSSG